MFFFWFIAELEIPENANVFYAVNRSDEAMHFILRRKRDQVLSKALSKAFSKAFSKALSMAFSKAFSKALTPLSKAISL